MEPHTFLKPVRDVDDYPVKKADLPAIAVTKLPPEVKQHPVPVKTSKLPESEKGKTHHSYGMVPLIKVAARGVHMPYIG